MTTQNCGQASAGQIAAAPFLRWAGGKRKLVRSLMTFLPADIDSRRYVEPFLGAASMFFAIRPNNAILSDANESLISVYNFVRDSPLQVLTELSRMVSRHGLDHYYQARDDFNRSPESIRQAATFIYLNMACFNGIYRVNRKGYFNVPKGSKEVLPVPTREELCAVSRALRVAKLTSGDYSLILAQVRNQDFVYLDPPYPALNGTSYFAHYTADRFDVVNQERLALAVNSVHQVGAKFLMSNADTDMVRAMYAGYEISTIPVQRFISCKGKRTAVSELIISNY